MFYRGDQGIHLAARNGHMSLVSAFVSSGCSLSSPGHHGNTVLHSAAQAAQLGVVKFCLARGVDPDCQNTRQETPLHLVAQFFARGWKSMCRFRTFICYYWSDPCTCMYLEWPTCIKRTGRQVLHSHRYEHKECVSLNYINLQLALVLIYSAEIAGKQLYLLCSIWKSTLVERKTIFIFF